MISLKPIFIFKYLKLKRNEKPGQTGRTFYLSWEDALWDVVEKKKVKKGSLILVPEFFCGDVEVNIVKHGYKIAHYPVSKKLKTTSQELADSLKKTKPSVLVILHCVGITNNLLIDTDWLSHVDKNIIVIEDCVHRIVDDRELKFISKNHFIIDSLRKVVPLQGSVLYAQKDCFDFDEPPFYQSFSYAFGVTWLWMTMNFLWSMTHIFKWTRISVWFAGNANKMMKKGYDLIGDSMLPARGFFLFGLIQRYLDIDKIKKIKKSQIEFYENGLKNLREKKITLASYFQSDKKEMIGFPLVISLGIADKTLEAIRKQGLLLDFELNDSIWSKKQKIIYLPIGLHLSNDDIKRISSIVRQAIDG